MLVFLFYLTAGMQRIHNTCDESAKRAKQDAADRAQRNRKNGQHNPQEVQRYSGSVKAEYVRSCHDPQIQVSRCKVGYI